jgi:hypothetical protein
MRRDANGVSGNVNDALASGPLRRYATERLLKEIDKMVKGPDGLDGDYFVDVKTTGEKSNAQVRLNGSKGMRKKLMFISSRKPAHGKSIRCGAPAIKRARFAKLGASPYTERSRWNDSSSLVRRFAF